jgi:hypothetical protein
VDCGAAADTTECSSLGDACTFSSSYNECKDACYYLTDSSDAEATSLESVCSAVSACAYSPDEGGGGILEAILILIAKLVAACVILYFLARFVLEKMFELFASSLELLYLGSLGYCTGLAALAIKLEFSGEIMAFLAGVSLTQLEYELQQQHHSTPNSNPPPPSPQVQAAHRVQDGAHQVPGRGHLLHRARPAAGAQREAGGRAAGTQASAPPTLAARPPPRCAVASYVV